MGTARHGPTRPEPHPRARVWALLLLSFILHQPRRLTGGSSEWEKQLWTGDTPVTRVQRGLACVVPARGAPSATRPGESAALNRGTVGSSGSRRAPKPPGPPAVVHLRKEKPTRPFGGSRCNTRPGRKACLRPSSPVFHFHILKSACTPGNMAFGNRPCGGLAGQGMASPSPASDRPQGSSGEPGASVGVSPTTCNDPDGVSEARRKAMGLHGAAGDLAVGRERVRSSCEADGTTEGVGGVRVDARDTRGIIDGVDCVCAV